MDLNCLNMYTECIKCNLIINRLKFICHLCFALPCLQCFVQAYVVLGQFLLLKKDKDDFESWLKDTIKANSKQAGDCYQCLRDWCLAFL